MDAVSTWTRSRIHFVGNALIDAHGSRLGLTRQAMKCSTGLSDTCTLSGPTCIVGPCTARALFGYRYVFKLDSDAAIVEPVNFDIFQDLALRDIKAAYFSPVVDLTFVCVNLYETMEGIWRYNQLKPIYKRWIGSQSTGLGAGLPLCTTRRSLALPPT